MKHLIVFDIQNLQHDYSSVMECITLLSNSKFDDFGDLLSKNLKDKFYRIVLEDNSVVPRYFECPQARVVNYSKTCGVLDSKQIEDVYYNTLSNDINNKANILDSLNNIFYTDDFNRTIKSIIPPSILSRIVRRVRTSRTQMEDAIDNDNINYHIRISVKSNQIYNLQYLALLLKKHQKLVKSKKISVFLLNEFATLHYYPFCNPNDMQSIKEVNESHKLFSRYLRLLAKDNAGIIYAPYYDFHKDKNLFVANVLPINFRDSSVGDIFFPLLEIGQEEYVKLFGGASISLKADSILTTEISEKDLYNYKSNSRSKYSLFQIDTWRFYDADSDNPHEAFLPFIAETAWRRLRKYWMQDEKFNSDEFLKYRDLIISRFTEEKNNWLSFAVFSFIFGGSNNRVNESYQISREITTGLQQIIQNAIQHSETNSCFFTFYLDEENNNLKLFVVDLNTGNTIVENFGNCLKKEIDICNRMQKEQFLDSIDVDFDILVKEHKNLINEDGIALRHLFNVFLEFKCLDKARIDDIRSKRNYNKIIKESNMRELWKKFRASDSTAHIGLLIFYQTLVHCNADLKLQSSKKYLANSNNVFIDLALQRNSDNRNNDRIDDLLEDDIRVIPGTQYLVTVPINHLNSYRTVGEASISNICNFSEDYSTFANFIDFKAEKISLYEKMKDIIKKVLSYKVSVSEDKFKAQLLWTKYWLECFYDINIHNTKNKVLYYNANDEINVYLSNSDNAEVFLKGMFAALNMVNICNDTIYFAMTNLTSVFLEVLRSVYISLANRKFPQNIQLYFVEDTCNNHAQIFGASCYEAIINSMHLAIEHGSSLFRTSDIVNAKHIASLSDLCEYKRKELVMPFDTLIPIREGSNDTIFDLHLCNMLDKRMDEANTQGYKLKDTHMRLGNKVHIQSFYEVSFLFYRTTISNRVAFKILHSYSKSLISKINLETFAIEPIMFYSYASYSKAILTSLVEMTRDYVKKFFINYFDEHKNEFDYQIAEEKRNEIIKAAQSQIAFASYQHNLQTDSDRDSIQLYFGIPENYSGAELKRVENSGTLMLKLNSDINVVMVVPISSTLSTFDKMFEKIKNRILNESNKKYKLRLTANYTALWVCDEQNIEKRLSNNILKPSNIESKYWDNAKLDQHIINVIVGVPSKGLEELKECPFVHFFICETAIWEHPLSCSLCFPDEKALIRELPLVETDLTSTVPSQQIRKEKSVDSIRINNQLSSKNDFSYVKTNNDRLCMLRDCVYYGHIKRSKNHHQYYISTQDFFYGIGVQKEIMCWLEGLRIKNNNFSPKLKIIFSPEHNTNVGFAQYVNTYYFGGAAEVISINEDKIFRSNFICEHEMLSKTMERLHIQNNIFSDDTPVEFYFVDDTINTGVTIHKANNLLRSLIPEEFISNYPAFLFKKCFILIDRMSSASKSSYVMSGNVSDFHSFVHIDISNMRVYGDSCVGCKLQKNAKKLFKRSSSRIMASYWANKYKHFKAVEYDNLDAIEAGKVESNAYERLILSHISQNYIFYYGISTREKGQYYDCILLLFESILNYSTSSDYDRMLLNNNFFFKCLLTSIIEPIPKDIQRNNKKYRSEYIKNSKLKNAELLLKLLARPFFSFDYSFKVQMLSFVLIIAECYLSNYSDDKIISYNKNQNNIEWKTEPQILYDMIPEKDVHKCFLRNNKRIERTVEIAKKLMEYHIYKPTLLSYFLKNILFEAIADMNSTYLLRRKVISRVNNFVDKELRGLSCENETNQSFGCNKCKYLMDSSQCKNKSMSNCFWISYIANVQRTIDCGSDEVKSIWFEYLVLSGHEISHNDVGIGNFDFISSYTNKMGIEKYVSDNTYPIATELLLTTAGNEFDITEKIITNSSDSEHFLNNYYLTRSWMKRPKTMSDNVKSWFDLLPSRNKKFENNNTDKRYMEFLDYLVKYISEVNSIDEDAVNVALLTMPRKDTEASIEKIQLVRECFGKKTIAQDDIRQAKYIIKDRVVNAINNDENDLPSIGILSENGYQIAFASNDIDTFKYRAQQEKIQYDSKHHVIGDHRKPYIVLLFDNPNEFMIEDELGRKIAPFNCVYLYISIEVSNPQQRRKIPLLILRDILAYRNRIMRLLSQDFNGDIMGNHASNMQEEAILTHERSASHASTTDEKGVLRAFGLGNVSNLHILKYPINVQTKQIIEKYKEELNYYHSADLWLLMQNYVNSQIARLFSRHFNSNDEELIHQDGIPELYLSKKDEQMNDIFKRCVVKFSDLQINFTSDNQDNRFKMLSKAANIFFYVEDDSILFSFLYDNNSRKYYNAEYMRCVILDIMFTSLKYATVDDSILPRVDNLINDKNETDFSAVKSYIIFFKDKKDLVILNNVKTSRISKDKIEFVNEEIYRRTHDALDYGDGHMSLFTIRNFILGLRYGYGSNDNAQSQPCLVDTVFKYLEKEDVKRKYKSYTFFAEHEDIINEFSFWFETRLPIFSEDICDD